MRRRSLLGVGAMGLVAVATGCGRAESAPNGSTRAGVPASTRPPEFDLDAYTPPDLDPGQLRTLFQYDAGVPLEAVASNRRDGAGVVEEELAYNDGQGGAVTTTVIAPRPGRGRVPGVVFAHAAGADHRAWRVEAAALAARGAVCALPRQTLSLTGDRARDSTVVISAVVAQRRALDVLVRRGDVDAGRLGFVGHGWGAAQGQIMAGVDDRLAAVGLVAPDGWFSRQAYGHSVPADARGYLDALTRFDGVRYVALAGRRTVLLQFGRSDLAVSQADFRALAERTAGAKEQREYDTADLRAAAPAAGDRSAFLSRVLRIT